MYLVPYTASTLTFFNINKSFGAPRLSEDNATPLRESWRRDRSPDRRGVYVATGQRWTRLAHRTHRCCPRATDHCLVDAWCPATGHWRCHWSQPPPYCPCTTSPDSTATAIYRGHIKRTTSRVYCRWMLAVSKANTFDYTQHLKMFNTATIHIELTRRALVVRSTSALDELAISLFKWCKIANIHEACPALVEPASSYKWGIIFNQKCNKENETKWRTNSNTAMFWAIFYYKYIIISS